MNEWLKMSPATGLPPSSTLSIPVARPEVGEGEAEACRRVILSGWLTQGPETRAFEAEFAASAGAAHAVATSSGTTALELALYALGIGAGDEVITASHSFIATANAIKRVGATPVFADIEAGSFNIDPARVAGAIGPRTRAILAVHQMGMPCDMQQLLALAQSANIPLVEDAACGAGSQILWHGAWQPIGRPIGTMACFSFHPRKVLTTGDGGMVTTDDARLASRMRALRVHGMDVDADVRHRSGVVFETYGEPGFNMRMTDIQAAIGRVQLAKLAAMVAARRARAARYHVLLGSIAGLGLPKEPAFARSNWQSYCVLLPERVDQRSTMEALAREGIGTRRGVMCAHREPAYPPDTWRAAPGGLTASEHAQDRGVILPLWASMRDQDQETVADALARACA